MEKQKTLLRLPWMQLDLEAVSRLIEPICKRLGIAGQAVDDVVQESLIVAETKCDGQEHDNGDYNGEWFSSPRIARAAMYACKCAKNIARNHRKRAYRRMTVLFDENCIDVIAPKQLDDIDFLDLAACVQRHLSEEENQLREMLEV